MNFSLKKSRPEKSKKYVKRKRKNEIFLSRKALCKKNKLLLKQHPKLTSQENSLSPKNFKNT